MSRVFLYARVSTVEQTAENQIAEAKAAGFAIRPNRIITETISGSVAARQRPELEKTKRADRLVQRRPRHAAGNKVDLKSTDLLKAELLRRAAEKTAKLGDRMHV